MTRRTRTASHWGSYWVTTDGGEVTAVDPVTEDPSPSPIGDNFRGTLRGRTRIARPAVRQGWLRDGPGAPGRGSDPYVEVSWERATALIAAEIDRVRTAHGNRDRKSTRLNSSHVAISYAVFCLK